MCIIVTKPQGSKVDLDTMKICGTNNDHGCGYAFHDGDKIQVRKFLSTEGLINSYKSVVQEKFDEEKVPAILHFRIATKGEVNRDNCHPFRITKKIVMAHNGTIRDIDMIDGATDSESFGKNYLSFLTPDLLKQESALKLISSKIGTSKLAFLDETGRITIVNQEKGDLDTDTGIWYSNSSYKSCHKRHVSRHIGSDNRVFPRERSSEVRNIADCKPKVSTKKTPVRRIFSFMRFEQDTKGRPFRGPAMGSLVRCCNCDSNMRLPSEAPSNSSFSHFKCNKCEIPFSCSSCGELTDDISVLTEICTNCGDHPTGGKSYTQHLLSHN